MPTYQLTEDGPEDLSRYVVTRSGGFIPPGTFMTYMNYITDPMAQLPLAQLPPRVASWRDGHWYEDNVENGALAETERRAVELLRSHLTSAQLADLDAHGWFALEGGRRWWRRPKPPVVQLRCYNGHSLVAETQGCVDAREVFGHSAPAHRGRLPGGDVALALKLAAECDGVEAFDREAARFEFQWDNPVVTDRYVRKILS